MSLKSPRYWRAVADYREQDKAREEHMNKTEEQQAREWIADTNEEMGLYAERQVIDAIGVYHTNQQAESKAKKGKEAASAIIKPYLERLDDHQLDDLERRLRARVDERTVGKPSYDVRAMPWQQVKKLWQAGCLSMNVDMLGQEPNTPLRMDAQPFMKPAGRTSFLTVVKIED